MAGRSAINLFQNVRKFYRTLGIYPPTAASNQTISLNRKNVFILIGALISFTLPSAYLLFEAKSISEFGVPFCVSVIVFSTIAINLVQIWRGEKIYRFIETCDEFIEDRLDRSPYVVLNERIERISRLVHFCLFYLSSPGALLPPFALSAVNYFVYGLGDESFYLIYPSWFPFDWRTPLGYLLAFLSQCLEAYTSITSILPMICFLGGSSWLFVYFAKDITQDLCLFNVNASAPGNDQARMKQQFCKMIKLHGNLEQMIDDLNTIIEFVILVLFLWSLLVICIALIIIQTELLNSNPSSAGIMVSLLMICWTLIFLFFCCELGEMVTNQFNLFDKELCRCDWYVFPVEMQQLYIIAMCNTQQATIIRGYGGIVCTRDSFKETIHGAFSYFMMLHRIVA